MKIIKISSFTLIEQEKAYTDIFYAGTFNYATDADLADRENTAIREAYSELFIYYLRTLDDSAYSHDERYKDAMQLLLTHFKRRLDQNVIGGVAHGRPEYGLPKGVKIVKVQDIRKPRADGQIVLFKKGELLSNDPHVYVIRSIPKNRLAFVELNGGNVKKVVERHVGDVVGEIAAFKKLYRSEEDPTRIANVILPPDTELLQLSMEEFESLCNDNPVFEASNLKSSLQRSKNKRNK